VVVSLLSAFITPVDAGPWPDDTTPVRQHRAAGLVLLGVQPFGHFLQLPEKGGSTREGYYS
jgi:hypothetical protein